MNQVEGKRDPIDRLIFVASSINMPIMVIDSFESSLPTLPMKNKDSEDRRSARQKRRFPVQYHSVKENSVSTQLATPIAGYIKEKVSRFTFLARQKLAEVDGIDEYMPGVKKKRTFWQMRLTLSGHPPST